MAGKNPDKCSNVIRLILAEKWLTLTVIGSVVTFQFISSFKGNILDPLLDFVFPEDKFKFMDISIRDGEEIVMPKKRKLTLRFGDWMREFIKWGCVMVVLFLVTKYSNFPSTAGGNFAGSAIM
jgi:large-conductance mechanosensitive channel